MKVKVIEKSYEEVMALKIKKAKKPKKPNLFWRTLLKLVSLPDLLAVNLKCNKIGMKKLKRREPCFILMNHSAFLDLEIATSIMYPRPINIVTTSDGFIGKNWLMRQLGCISTKKFTTDSKLVRDMLYTVNKLKSSILMYPEAGYTFDGTTTTLTESLGKCVKMLGIPLVFIITSGAYFRQPLYNNLRKRKVQVEVKVEYALSKEDVMNKTEFEINAIIAKYFSFDNFKWQQENNVIIDDPNRAEGLHRILYKCPHCLAEGKTEGIKDRLICKECGKEYVLTPNGYLEATDGETIFKHIPDWCKWERNCVKEEIIADTYSFSKDVDIYMMVDTYSIYKVGDGHLSFDKNGYNLTGCNGKLNYHQNVLATHTINVDFYWYQIGDTISIGDSKALYYCFPKDGSNVACKVRYAQEELYKILKK